MDGDKHWYDDDRLYPSVSNSDDSPILSHRYENSRLLSPYAAPKIRERRSTFTVLAKFFLFCTAMILFCVLLYIPVYNKANDLSNVRVVAGWSMDTNRDTKIYVQPKNNTTIHSPRNICPRSSNDRLFLLIVVCSSTVNFKRREAIRETWGNYRSYQEMSKLYHTVKQRYITYNYTYDLYNEQDANNVSIDRVRRDISSFSRLLPELAKVLKDNLVNNEKTDDVLSEKRFDDDVMLPEFDMNAELGENTVANYEEYYEDTNIMKIPPKGYEDTPDLEKVLSMLKGNKNFKKVKEKLVLPDVSDPDYKVVFLLGMPTNDNDSYVQNKIEEESEKYGDVIQEGFVDSYNNLTLKSIMMLKWITNNCNDSVRYFLKTDDDMYINVPSLIENLRNRSRDFDLKNKGRNAKEYMLIGDLICGARPVSDFNNKWYSPKYMYGGHVYPKYLSGTGYALSAAAARALYGAALRTNYFHLEDVYITGFCAGRAHPRIIPRDDSSFSYLTPWWASGGTRWSGSVMRACAVHARATAHRVAPDLMVKLHTMLRRPVLLDTCERMRLTKVKEQQRKNNVVSKFLRILVTTECK
ncbi:hypothetical protein PYW07_011901 [Mythimna separata]|uniref:Uncharacterized protein n=1 Tax=Mythimna separata TaxID=271217 RepID=A0AAD7Y765_MYTSE|nr:hypothetical protein PYW07_011901 [Mythimna separata]